MKTQGMKHQLQALRRMKDRDSFGLFMEQGTGKTWCFLADAERLYGAGRIDALLIVAPKGVHTNWVRREIPTHMGVPHIAEAWRSGAGKIERARLEKRLFKPRERGDIAPLRILSINIDAVTTKDGYAYAKRFLESSKALMVVDESSRIKTPGSLRSLQIVGGVKNRKHYEGLRKFAAYARIGTGTPITNAPMDVFNQMEFLESGLLGTTSYRAFTAEYAELLDSSHPMFRQMLQNNPRIAYAQIIATDPITGAKRWRNLDKLQKLLEPHTFRVLKKDCLDLPEKVYKNLYFELDAKQQVAYRTMENKFRIEFTDGSIKSFAKLNAVVKLQQITSGFIKLDTTDAPPHYVSDANPRLKALLDAYEELDDRKVIIWAHFKEEIRAIAAALRKAGRRVVEYHGDVSDADRELAVDRFQGSLNNASRKERGLRPIAPSEEADDFVGQGQSGGIGLTLTAATRVFYFSNSYNLETRKQTEDRSHRIGTKETVVYTDIVAEDTVDENIAAALQRKSDLAAMILGDAPLLLRRHSAF